MKMTNSLQMKCHNFSLETENSMPKNTAKSSQTSYYYKFAEDRNFLAKVISYVFLI